MTGRQEGPERIDLEPGELRTRSQAGKARKEIASKNPFKKQNELV